MIPRPSQIDDLLEMEAHNYIAMLQIETGGGKTALSTFGIRDSGADTTLVVAPSQTMRSAWIPTTADILGVEAREIGNKNKAQKQAYADLELGYPGVYMVTPQLVSRMKNHSLLKGDMLIIDESHEVMTPEGQSQRRLSGYTPQESDKAIARRFGGRLTLSGTAFRNRFELAWGYGRTLWPELDGRDEPSYLNHYVWKKDRMTYTDEVIAFEWVVIEPGFEVPEGARVKKIDGVPHWGKVTTAKKWLAEAEPGKWISEVPCVVTHLKREPCCVHHPEGFLPLAEPTVIHETVELLPEQRKAVKELEATMLTYLEDHPLAVDIPLTLAQRIRQITLAVPTLIPVGDGEYEVVFAKDAKSPVLDRFFTILDTDVDGETCVLWTESQKFAEVATYRLNQRGIKAFEYSGKTRNTRDNDVDRFGSEFRVMVATIASAGSGLDGLQYVCNNEVTVSSSLDETLNVQRDGRLDRDGQTTQVMSWFLHDDLGLSEGRYSDAVARRLQLNKSLRRA